MQNKDTTAGRSALNLIDVIDLTKDSPVTRARRLSRRRTSPTPVNVSTSHDVSEAPTRHQRCKRHTIIRRNQIEDVSTSGEESCHDFSCVNEIVTIIDDTIFIEDDDNHYTIKSDKGELIPLMCPICFELFNHNLKPTTTRCGHLFCEQCLVASFRMSKKCPACNTSITLKSCVRVFL